MDAWKNCVLSAGKPMSIKFCVLGGGVFGGGGGGKCRFYFYGRADFSDKMLQRGFRSRGTKIRVLGCAFGPLSSHPFSLIFPPSFSFKPCSLSHHFSPLHHPPFIPLFVTPGKLRFRYPSDLGTLLCPAMQTSAEGG